MSEANPRVSKKLVGKRVLVADDDAAIRRIVQLVLGSQGLEVTTAEDGEDAFQKAVTEKPDAILLDIRMPKMDGFELCSKLRATPATAEIPIGFLTAERDLDSYKLAQELGGLIYITKPFKPERLIDTVGLMLTGKARPPKR